MRRVILFLSILSVVLLGSCTKAPVISHTETTAEKEYRVGIYYLKHKDYDKAEAAFSRVISDYTYSAYEPYATVALGKVYMERKEYAAASEVFKRFLRMRPDHKLSSMALYLLAKSYWEQRPSSFFMLPNPSDKDLNDVELAARYYRAYLDKYPNGDEVKVVKKELSAAEMMLLTRELRVAEYYARTKHCNSTKMRLAYIDKHFTVTSDEVKSRIEKLHKKCPGKAPVPPVVPVSTPDDNSGGHVAR